ncbi:MAG TPA: 2-amino-4-hydroxy-6-hydroxymethyldihydropteridine diphosphokinase [Terracidiphilus sp.]|jgi:2-amino-4-hydroxy-6-hydroxymethyldihydropteridine diphosphokinase
MPTAYIGLGANLPSSAGPPSATLAAAVGRLASMGRMTARSRLYSTEPVGYRAQPRFLNAVVALETELSPRALLEALLSIEGEFGRDRTSGIANGPRTLDLDLLIYGIQPISEPGLEVPHPRLAERAFVLVPLTEIAPLATDTRSGLTVSQLLERLRQRNGSEADAVVPIQSDVWCAGVGSLEPDRARS